MGVLLFFISIGNLFIGFHKDGKLDHLVVTIEEPTTSAAIGKQMQHP
jgi:hypothetical protein